MRDYDSYKLHLKLLLVHLATAEKRSYDTNSVGKFRSQFHDGKSLKRIAFSLIIRLENLPDACTRRIITRCSNTTRHRLAKIARIDEETLFRFCSFQFLRNESHKVGANASFTALRMRATDDLV